MRVAVVRRSPARSRRLDGPPVGVGGAAARERRLRHAATTSTSTRARSGSFRRSAPRPAMFRRDGRRRLALLAGPARRAPAPTSTAARPTGSRCRSLCPAKLFWSVTVYDAETRSQIQTDQSKAALRSLFELEDLGAARRVDLYFGPKPPDGQRRRVDQDAPRTGLVRLLPHLWPGGGRLRRQLAAPATSKPSERSVHTTGGQQSTGAPT